MKGRVFIVSAFSFQGRILSDTFFLQMTEKFFISQKRHLCYVIGGMNMHQLTIDWGPFSIVSWRSDNIRS